MRRKQSFFEKKDQKTFVPYAQRIGLFKDKSFLVLFFKKGLLAFFLLFSPFAAEAVTVTGAWARASLPHQDASAAYMTLRSATQDALTGVTIENGMAMLHQTTHSGGMSGMADMDSVVLPAGQAVTLAPGGTHIMLMDLKHAPRPGETLSLTLHFAHAGTQVVSVPVRPVGAGGP